MRLMRFAAATLVFAIPPGLSAQERVDLEAIQKIRAEALERSQIMELASWLTDVHGPRLTNSPTSKAAGDWAVQTMTRWGLSGARLEPWGDFGMGWENQRMFAQVTAPVPFPVIAYPSAWTPGTDGPVTAKVIQVQIDTITDVERYRGTLRGVIVLQGQPRDLAAPFEAQASRLTEAELATMAAAEPQAAGGQGGQRFAGQQGRFQAMQQLNAARTQLFIDEGVAAVLTIGRGDVGTVFVSGSGGSRNPANPARLPTIVVAAEHFNRIARILAKGLPVTMELDVRNRFYEDDLTAWNVVAEIPGTDKRDEVVMLGAHFDSWHGGTGATDNAAGSAVMMEAVRILKALDLPLRRTVRIALWTGEEQGLLGSRAYVTAAFGTAEAPTPAHAKFSSYFNVDNGTGAIRGVYLQGNSAVKPVFDAWMKPFADKGVTTLTIRNTGGTDHLSFDRVGLPGFQFIQDGIDYGSRTHHSSMDVWERLQPDDMKLNAAVVAAFVYLAANRDDLLPRKPAAMTP